MSTTHDLSVIDLSHHNPTPNWQAAADGGLVGILHKSSEGLSYVDDQYWRRRRPAEDAGLLWGAYHFLKPGRAADQMQFFMNQTMLAKGSRVVIDYEDESCTLADLREAVATLQQIAPSLQIAVYSGHLIKDQLGDDYDALLASTSLWIAQYTADSTPAWPSKTWPVWSLWQYSDGSSGGQPRTFPGFQPPFDCNVFNGSKTACAKWMGPAGEEPAPPQPIEIDPVTMTIPAGQRLIVNGVEVEVPR